MVGGNERFFIILFHIGYCLTSVLSILLTFGQLFSWYSVMIFKHGIRARFLS